MAIITMYATGVSPAEFILNPWQEMDVENIPNELKPTVLTEPEYHVAEQPKVSVLTETVTEVTQLEQEIHQWTNHYRQEHDLNPLSFNLELANIARTHSQDMAQNNYFSHTNLQDEGPADRAERERFHCHINLSFGWYVKGISENIWQGWIYSYTIGGVPGGFLSSSKLAQNIVDDWMNSPGHRKNILTEFWKSEGIGVAITEDGKVYATQDFC